MLRHHNDKLRRLACFYNRLYNLPDIVEGHYVEVDPTQAQRMVAAYEQLPTVAHDWHTHLCYQLLAEELRRQWDCIVSMGYTLEPWEREGQPYANSAEMMTDLRNRKHLYFFIGGEPHPFLNTVDDTGFNANEQLRAVHDVFGHAAEGYQFGPRGEENAWIHHSMMLTPLAQRAMSTETRGQNTWVNAGPYKDLFPCDRPYAAQKAALLPIELTDWKAALEKGNN